MAIPKSQAGVRYPRPIRRYQTPLMVLYLLSGFAIVAAFSVGYQLFIAVLIIELAAYLYARNRTHSWVERAVDQDLQLCVKCGEPWSSEPACSGCGRRVDRTDDPSQWRAAVLRYTPKRMRPAISMYRQYHFYVALIVIGASLMNAVFVYLYGEALLRTAQKSIGTFPSSVSSTASSLSPYMYGAMGLTALVSVVLIFVVENKVHKGMAKAKENNFCLCTKCLYPLDTEQPSGHCPECGLEYDIADVRRRWYVAWGRRHIPEAARMNVDLGLYQSPKLESAQ